MPINFDAIRLFAILAIVVLHVSANGVNRQLFGSHEWWIAESFNALCRAGVPLFLMLTGALLLRRRNTNLSDYYRRRWQRLAPALIGWSLFYLLWSYCKAQIKHQAFSIHMAIDALLSGAPYFHLWFVYMLVGVYATLPLMSWIWHQLTLPQRQVLGVILLLVQQFGLAGYFALQGPSMPWPLWFLAYLPYVWLGAVLAELHSSINWRGAIGLSLVGGIVLATCIAWLRYVQQLELGPKPFYYSHHRLSTPVLLSALCWWLLLSKCAPSLSTKATWLMPLSLHIYCAHPLFIDISEFAFQRLSLSYFVQLPLQIILVLAASIVLAAVVVSRNNNQRFFK